MSPINRRDFLKLSAAGGAICAARPDLFSGSRPGLSAIGSSKLVSPGCRGTKVKVAKIYMGKPQPHWPKPTLDLAKEVAFYESHFARLKDEFADVDFVVDRLVTSPEEVAALKDRLRDVDGILAIHLTIWINPILDAVLDEKKPTMIFAAPYSGHEWTGYGGLLGQEKGALAECLLTSDYDQLAFAVRPFRAIHHLREARVLNLTTRPFEDYAGAARGKFGTEIVRLGRDRVLRAYDAVGEAEARAETDRWLRNADKLVEPSKDDVYRSCRLALALERILDEEQATVMAIDCYGSMWDKTITLPAYPCVGLSRLNNLGWGGICESDLRSAMTHIIFQGLSGKPGFISDPTVDEGRNAIILAHCMGTLNMDGPAAPAHPYKLRTVMEREEGVVPQVEMRVGQKVTQAILVGMDRIQYFTGEIVEAPVGLEHDRGCRTKIAVRVDGDLSRLWRSWSQGLHRQTCYGDITRELRVFSKFKAIALVDEAA
ncbi:MAG: twin-arginine translocation signal domain-containing protein [Candidatus Aminicenantes bacterium]